MNVGPDTTAVPSSRKDRPPPPMDGTLEDRIAALERAVTDGDHDCSALAEGAAAADRVADVEAELEALQDRVVELEAATQALRGYVGNVRSVNTDVEERADLALSKAEAARRAVDQMGDVPGEGHAADAGSEFGTPQESEPTVQRCERCERPFEETSDARSPRGNEESPGPSAEPSRLDALRDSGAARSGEVRTAIASAQTDGGLPDERDDGSDAGVLARIRRLL